MSNISAIVLNGVIAIIAIIIILISIINLFYMWRTYNRNNQVAAGTWPGLLVLMNILGIILGIVLLVLAATNMLLASRRSKQEARICGLQQVGQGMSYDQFGNPIPQVTTTSINTQVPQATIPPVTTNPVQSVPAVNLPTIPSTVDVV